MADRRAIVVGGLVLAGLVAAGGYAALHSGLGPLPDPEGCSATAGNHSVSLSVDQARNASIVAAVAERRGLPARAISIAMAAAYQESKLHNIASGDRDSLGLFQQRPSQGWGTRAQVMDPYHAANAFYDALVKVDGYATMEITSAAQAVQRSAYPDAYAGHEADGRTVASALSGYSKAAFTCVVDAEPVSGDNHPRGVTARVDAVRRDLESAFGSPPLGGLTAGGEPGGHSRAPGHDSAIDIVFRPIDADNTRRGWAVAQYLVANARRLHIARVIFDKRVWTSGNHSADGWLRFTPPHLTGRESSATRAVLEHRDHIHVDVS